jgi:transposase
MERLEPKTINGKTYYYYSIWGWKNGKCRRLKQTYLGSLQNIAKTMEGGGPSPKFAEVFQWGLPSALWLECSRAQIVSEIDQLCPKRNQGMTTGQYLAIAALNRTMQSCSKRSMWEWFSQTAFVRHFPEASRTVLSSQRFWDHMDRIDESTALECWKRILKGAIAREGIDLASISYDGTNFYTFIDTFNGRCDIAKRGKNKQGRSNLRQVSYALFCCADGRTPLYYDVYDGNRNDAKQFSGVIRRFSAFMKEVSGSAIPLSKMTVVFDKGNNSADNLALLDSLNLHFVGSVKLDQHKDLMLVPNDDHSFVAFEEGHLEGTSAFRVTRELGGQDRTLIITFNQSLFHAQWLTLQADIQKAIEILSSLQQSLDDRISGVVKSGKPPTKASVEKQCKHALRRQHLGQVFETEITLSKKGLVKLEFSLNTESLLQLSNTYLGKTIVVTTRHDWNDARIVRAYRSQYIIENVFKEMKDRSLGTWWPLQHWTDSKIKVHGLYCSIALLLRAMMMRRIETGGLNLSMKRVFAELGKIKQVINIYPKKRGQKKNTHQVVFTEVSPLQEEILTSIGLEMDS